MEQTDLSLRFELKQTSPHFCKATIIIPKEVSRKAYEQAVLAQQKSARAYGFNKKNVPVEYIKKHFEFNIKKHLQEFLFKYFALSFLHQEIKAQKLNIAGDPRLTDIAIHTDNDSSFHFDISLFPKIEFQNWKYYPFKAPKRKNYKDLDRQVDTFMKSERRCMKENSSSTAEIEDWVSFDIWLIDEHNNPIFGTHRENLWIKIGDEEADQEFQTLFLEKQIGDIFYAAQDTIQEYFGSQIGSNYHFGIQIKDIVKYSFFCFEKFKRQFRLKTKKEIARRLIEVFSYRNDVSQRHAMVDEAFKLMLSKYKFDVPNYLILRQQQKILELLQQNPDYHVYKNQKDFKDQVRKLSKKQIKEIILIDQLANKENINATDEDIVCYLNLTKRPRMKEFIYFKIPNTTVEGQEMPISSEIIRKQCTREKTLNYVIYHFTRK